MKKKLVILGAGESGVGAAILGKDKGFYVFVSDKAEIKANFKQELTDEGILFEEEQHTEILILDADLVVKSPGIPDTAPIIQKLKERSISVVSEIEFAGEYTNAKLICITGSNGKTTTTMQTYELLKGSGINVGLAGNVGFSFARQVARCDYTHYVLELSSFQLDGMFDFRAHVAVLLNITPDHLDRYEYKMGNYIASKFRIVQNQKEDDYFIYFADDKNITASINQYHIKSQQIPFSLERAFETNGAYVEDDKLKVKFNQNSFEMSIFDLAIKGKHNTCNSMAAAIIGKVSEIRNEYIRECLSDFKGVEHRLEKYLSVHGIEFINDSKATNINSTWYALESMKNSTVWIVGGIDKGNDYNELMHLVKDKVKAIVCLGLDNSKIIEAFSPYVKNIIETQSMEHAVKSAYFLGETGDTVLLSPACASFDLFKNYEERGKLFKDAVRAL